MTDKVEDEVVDEEVVEEKVETPEETTYSATETSAMEQGWLPKDQWEESGKDPAEWRSAKEFQERGEFYKTIHQQKREIKQTQAALDGLRRHHEFVFDQAYRKAKAELRKDLREARRADDIDTMEAVEEQIEQLDTEYTQQKTQLQTDVAAAAPQEPAEFGNWKARNGWYENDQKLRNFADAYGMSYAKEHPGVSSTEVLKEVEDVVRQKFPEKFGTRRSAPNAVNSVDRTGGTRKRAAAEYQLDETETAIMNDLVRSGAITKEQYISDLKKIKGEK